MKANLIQEIPELTAKVVKAAFPKGNKVVTIRDELGVIFADADFAELYAKRGQPGVSPSQLAMVTLLQYMEDLPDRQAAEAVRSRIDWKYALGLELTDAGFDYSVLSEFRQRLVDGEVEHLLFEKLLEACADKELLGGKKKQRTDLFWFTAKWTKGDFHQSLRILNIGQFVLPKLIAFLASKLQFLLAIGENLVGIAVEFVSGCDVANRAVQPLVVIVVNKFSNNPLCIFKG